MANNKIIHVATAIDANDAVNKSYEDTQINNFLKTELNQWPLILKCPIKKINLASQITCNDVAKK